MSTSAAAVRRFGDFGNRDAGLFGFRDVATGASAAFDARKSRFVLGCLVHCHRRPRVSRSSCSRPSHGRPGRIRRSGQFLDRRLRMPPPKFRQAFSAAWRTEVGPPRFRPSSGSEINISSCSPGQNFQDLMLRPREVRETVGNDQRKRGGKRHQWPTGNWMPMFRVMWNRSKRRLSLPPLHGGVLPTALRGPPSCRPRGSRRSLAPGPVGSRADQTCAFGVKQPVLAQGLLIEIVNPRTVRGPCRPTPRAVKAA